jgi:hypothetical protein
MHSRALATLLDIQIIFPCSPEDFAYVHHTAPLPYVPQPRQLLPSSRSLPIDLSAQQQSQNFVLLASQEVRQVSSLPPLYVSQQFTVSPRSLQNLSV